MDKNDKLKILFVEDVDADYELAMGELLRNEIFFVPVRVENGDDFKKALNEFKPDLVISDYSLPQFNGMQALKIAKDHDISLPFIIVTGTMNEEIAVECMKAGATDYVIKEHIGRLSFAANEALRYRDAMLEKAKAKNALLESELRYRSMFENNYAVMLLVDQEDAAIVDANPAASDYYGFSHNDIINKNFSEICFLEKKILLDMLNLSKTGNKNHFISKHKIKNNTERDVEVFLSPINYMGRKLVHCIIQDITERNKAIAALQTSINEKKELIKEIYHRTKNNMQVIISMFTLQSILIGDDKLESVLKDMENRIRAMSLVHEKLYQSKDLSKLNLKDYLEDLIHNILSAYGIPQDKIMIVDQMKYTEVLIDTAVPCGLVVNELISNTAKHAFPGEKKGELLIKLSTDKTGEIELVIADNGVGAGTNPDINGKGSMGLQIVKNIVEYQLQGSVEVDNSAGIKWTVKFRDNIYEERI
ncbi:MAG TPA: histidine kinase dimerization/phosphoacceptor domain -containing protein [Spirochaetota bacterium]|mgnify:CR=1 FL=1|nr:histidine kinase dimerization/phosphoacceptor domain -containing protein [Spirochaetota bacterium]